MIEKIGFFIYLCVALVLIFLQYRERAKNFEKKMLKSKFYSSRFYEGDEEFLNTVYSIVGGLYWPILLPLALLYWSYTLITERIKKSQNNTINKTCSTKGCDCED